MRVDLPAAARLASAFVAGISKIVGAGISEGGEGFDERSERNGTIIIFPAACQERAGVRVEQEIRDVFIREFAVQYLGGRLRKKCRLRSG